MSGSTNNIYRRSGFIKKRKGINKYLDLDLRIYKLERNKNKYFLIAILIASWTNNAI